jgi:hypothetical protein
MAVNLTSLGIIGSKQKKDASTLDDLLRQNDSSRQKLSEAGYDDPTREVKPSMLERIFGPLDALGTGVRGLVYNAVSDKDVDVWGEMGKALKGEDRVEGADILDELGVDNKWLKMGGGLVLDILLDPTTYITFGYGGAAKAAGKSAITGLGKAGMHVDDVARALGRSSDDIARELARQIATKADDADEVARIAADILGGARKIGIGELDNAAANVVKSQTMREAASAVGDTGGVKLFGQTIAPVQGKMDKAAASLADMALGTKPGRWAQQSFASYGEKIPAGANALERIAIPGITRQQEGIVRKGSAIGKKIRALFERELPDEEARNVFTVAIGREFGDVETRRGIDGLYKTINDGRDEIKSALAAAGVKVNKGARDEQLLQLASEHMPRDAYEAVSAKIGATQAELRQVLAETYNPNAVREAFIQSGYSEEVADKAQKMSGEYHKLMDEMAKVREEAGLPAWTLYGEYLPDGAAGSAGYAPGRRLKNDTNILGLTTKATRESQDAQSAALKRLGLNIEDATYGSSPLSIDELIDPARGAGRRAQISTSPKAYKSKEYVDAERAMLDGGLIQDRDIARLAEAKVVSDYTDIASQGLSDAFTGMGFRPEMADEVAKAFRGSFAEPESVKGFLKVYDRLQNKWKRAATAMRLPAFQSRNMLSNKILQAMRGVLDPESEARSFDLVMQIAKGAKNVDDDEVARLIELGVIQTAEEFAEQTGGAAFKNGSLTKLGGSLNELVENQGRIGAFYAAKKKGLDDFAASDLVNTALYNYSNQARSELEKSLIMRVVPFYKWTRSNLPNMAELLVKEPGKVGWLGHLIESGGAVSEYDESVMPEWLRELNPVPLPAKYNGNPVMISTEGLFPQNDLEIIGKVLTGELNGNDVLSYLSPLIRTPLETLVFNKDVYYDEPLQAYEGEKKRAPGYVEQFGDLANEVPVLREVWGLVTSTLGIQERTSKDGEDYYWMDARAAKAMKDLVPWMNQVSKYIGGADPNKTVMDRISATGVKPIYYDTEQFEQNKAYEDRDALMGALAKMRDEATAKPGLTLQDIFGGR